MFKWLRLANRNVTEIFLKASVVIYEKIKI